MVLDYYSHHIVYNSYMMIEEIDLIDIKNKLIQKLKPSGWVQELKGFLYSSDFDKVIQLLYEDRKADKRFTPTLKQVFRAFEECPVDKLQVVMIGQDPYQQIGVADGLAFSCGNTGKPQPSLIKMFDALDPATATTANCDLTRWANQGVLLLNSAFTCRIDSSGNHYLIWHDFMAYLMEMLGTNYPDLIYVFIGTKAKEWEEFIPTSKYTISTEHPTAACYENRKWEGEPIFNFINTLLSPKKQIIW